MSRNDVHSPKNIIPADYQFVAHEFLKVEDLGTALFLQAERQRVKEHMAKTGGTYSKHEHGGNCMVCGSVNAIYTILFYHVPTNSYVRMGADCAEKCEFSDYGHNAFRAHIEDARQAQAGKKKALALLTDAGVADAWGIYLDSGIVGYEEGVIRNIVGKLVQYGSASEKQFKYLHVLLNKIANRAEQAAKQAAEKALAADCPVGRIQIEGTVLTLKEQETAFGLVTKMLVKHDSGYKVWGTKPRYTDVERGCRVSFTATVERSKDDAKFGFFSRPTNAQVITAATKEEVAA